MVPSKTLSKLDNRASYIQFFPNWFLLTFHPLSRSGLFDIEALGKNGATKFLQHGKVFQGGNWQHLHAMLEVSAGDEILYVGDHLYADVLRSKRTLGWRSMFIMPELEDEIRVFSKTIPLARKIAELRDLRDEIGAKAEEVRRTGELDDPRVKEKLAGFEADDKTIKATLSTVAEQWHGSFHEVWGAMFNAGYQDSRFAFYVENYACLYTARATNLGLASNERSFRTSMERLPHDKLLAGKYSILDETDPWK